MNTKQQIECPQCQGPLKVWIDVDASLFFNVSRSGKLSKRVIEDNAQADGRCGLKCQVCTWKVYGADGIEDDALQQVIQDADAAWGALDLKVVPRKN
ncbi:hypothetical protein [Pseudomonas mosselii]|uniref:hypothetical protein n=1 Tax=Pseudomonas mosselii TaxID=78327 RepID=UPI0021DAB313|nr:hypothetical protein [Pseudomonas mosselii]MCU9528052.1 hypothetical protein [Pseudomonas mosselii]MCU9535161.1 hypothetical protein [Pseudomonas mosselii]MCU9542680.1 hypothetical protein [Pseudomonas mosselii]MCU9546896.1 hypothetical protein [Pseudomonas mosselii]